MTAASGLNQVHATDYLAHKHWLKQIQLPPIVKIHSTHLTFGTNINILIYTFLDCIFAGTNFQHASQTNNATVAKILR